MNIHELMEQLSRFPEDIEVVVQGYEDGFDPVISLKAVRRRKAENMSRSQAEYEELDSTAAGGENAVAIWGRRGANDNTEDVW